MSALRQFPLHHKGSMARPLGLADSQQSPVISWLAYFYDKKLQRERKTITHTKTAAAAPIYIRGLKNLGNTCFMNSVLQVLASLRPFVQYLEGLRPRRDVTPFSHSLLQCINELESTTEDPQPGDPSLLRVLIATKHRRFNHCEQQDAEEMLQVIMSLVQEDANRISSISSMRSILDTPPTASPTSSLSSLSYSIGSDEDLEPRLYSLARVPSAQSLSTTGAALASVQVPHGMLSPLPFQGWVASHLTCSRCEKSRPINHQPFIDLSLPLPNTQSAPVMSSRFGTRQATGLNSYFEPQAEKDVRDLLKQYVQNEDIDNVECARCTAEYYTNCLTEELEKYTSRTNSPTASIADVSYTRDSPLAKGDPQQPLGELVDALRRLQVDIDAVNDRDLPSILRSKKAIRAKASRVMKLSRMPPVLCIHLCRRVVSPVTGVMTKMVQHISFPITLDINEIFGQGGELERPGELPFKRRTGFAKRPPRSNLGEYTLHAVIVHQGTADSGHYVTYRMANDRWYFISDTNVREATEREVLGSQAYMLFYPCKSPVSKLQQLFRRCLGVEEQMSTIHDINKGMVRKNTRGTKDLRSFRPSTIRELNQAMRYQPLILRVHKCYGDKSLVEIPIGCGNNALDLATIICAFLSLWSYVLMLAAMFLKAALDTDTNAASLWFSFFTFIFFCICFAGAVIAGQYERRYEKEKEEEEMEELDEEAKAPTETGTFRAAPRGLTRQATMEF